MDFGTLHHQTRGMLLDLVTTFARLLTRHGNRVGALLYGERIDRTIPARGGKLQVLRIANELIKQPRLSSVPMTNLRPLLEGALNIIKRRSLVFLISDFISEPGWEKPLGTLNHRHEIIAVRLHDPSELELPDLGPVVMEDAETGDQLYMDTHDPVFRRAYGKAVAQREQALSAIFKHAGVDLLPLSISDDLVRAIVRFAALREQRRSTV
jgi:uncharacterized protein (DUF58 family)